MESWACRRCQTIYTEESGAKEGFICEDCRAFLFDPDDEESDELRLTLQIYAREGDEDHLQADLEAFLQSHSTGMHWKFKKVSEE